MKRIALLFILIVNLIQAQTRLVLDGAYMNISSGANLVIDNSNQNAITRNAGHIISETENSNIIWKLGSTLGTYTVPLGYSTTNYIPFIFTKAAGVGAGQITFATYKTANWQNSLSLPTGVPNVNTSLGNDYSAYLMDRYWKIDATGYSTKPDLSNVEFTYIDAEHAVASNTITESDLVAQRFNSNLNSWWDNLPTASVSVTGNKVSITSIPSSDLYKWWTLSNSCTLPNSSAVTTSVMCNGFASGSSTITATGLVPLNYAWSTGATTSTLGGLLAGSYNYTVSNTCGATTVQNVTVAQPVAPLETTTLVGNVLCNGGSTGSATITATGGRSPYTYLWSSAQTTSVITSQPAGVKTVTVTDANGCISTNTVTITQPTLALSITSSSVINSSGTNGSIGILASGGTPAYTYSWSPGNPTGQGTATITALTVGTYSCLITDANNCTTTSSFTVLNGGSSLNFDGVNDYVNCPIPVTSFSTGILTLEAWVKSTANSSFATIIKNWGTTMSGGFHLGTTNAGNNLEIFILQSNGTVLSCSDPAAIALGTWYHVAVVADGTTVRLYKNGIQVASVAYNGTLYTGFPHTFIGAKPVDAGNSGVVGFWNGNIDEVRVWNRALCQSEIQNNMNGELASAQINLLAYYKFNQGIASASNPTVTTAIDASGNNYNASLNNFALTGASSNWVNPGGVVSGNTVMPIASSTIAISGASVICSGTPATFTASGNVSTYTWTAGPNTNTYSINPSTTTTYSVIGTNSLGCISNMATKTLTVHTTPTITVNSGTICSGDNFTITPSGAATYTIQGGTNLVSPLTLTNYTVLGESIDGCLSSNTVTSTVDISKKVSNQNGNWNDPLVWTPNGVPTSCDVVIISNGHQVEVDGNAICGDLYIGQGTAATLQFGATACILESKNVTINTNAKMDLGLATNTISASKDFINNGNVNARQGLVLLNGTSSQSIGGTNTTSFYDITVDNHAGVVLNTNENLVNTLMLNNGTFNTNSKVFTMVSTATNTARIAEITGTGDIVGNVNVQRYAPGGYTGWALFGTPISSPLTLQDWDDDIPISCNSCPDGSAGGFLSIYHYDETAVGSYSAASAYIPLSSITDPIIQNKGYWVYLGTGASTTTPITIDVTGLVRKFNNVITLTNTNTGNVMNDGWNVIHNPFPSPIKWSLLKGTNPNVDDAIYSYNADLNGGLGGSVAYVNGVSSPAVGAGGIGDTIPMSQGFQVHCSASTSLVATEGCKVGGNPTYLKTNNTTAIATSSIPLIRINLMGASNRKDETVVYYQSGATDNFDATYDAIKYESFDPYAPSIKLVDGTTDFQINAIDASSSVFSMPLKTTTGYAGTYTINLSNASSFPSSTCISLYDTFNGVTTDLKASNYTFTMSASSATASSRFVFNINNVSISNINTTTGKDTICSGESIILIANGASNYLWSNGAATNSISVAPAVTTTYSVSTNIGNCLNSTSKTIEVMPLPTIFASSNNTLLCAGQSATLSAIGASNYSWSSGSASSVTIITPTVSTTYTVVGTNQYGCYSSTTITQLVNVCTGISYNAESNEVLLSIYPNPTNWLLNIDLARSAQIIITNALGQIIKNESMPRGLNKLNIENEANGVYFIKAIDESEQQIIKFVKEN